MVITGFLTSTFNECITSEKFPNCLKLAKVIALKKGDENNPENYGPISLISTLSKNYEKLLYKRMTDFFTKCKLFSPYQYDFRAELSCVHATSEVTENMREGVHGKLNGFACFIDLKKPSILSTIVYYCKN